MPTATRCRRQSVRRQPAGRAAGDLGVRPAQPVALHFDDRSRSAAPARWSSATSARTRFEEIDYEPPGRGGRNYGWRNREGAQPNPNRRRRRHRPRFSPSSIRSTSTAARRAHRSPAASSTAGARSAPLSRPLLLRRLRERPRLVRGALAVGSNGEATSVGLTEHTAELGAMRSWGTSALSASINSASSTS